MPSPMSERHAPLTASAGIGLKPQHAADLLDRHAVGFFEVHAENYMGAGGPPHALLRRVRESLPLSLHGLGFRSAGRVHSAVDHVACGHANSAASQTAATAFGAPRRLGPAAPRK